MADRLLDALRLLPADLIELVGSIRIDPGFPAATATLPVERFGEAQHDVALDDDEHVLSITQRPTGPRRIGDEPPIKMTARDRHPDLVLSITAADTWGQCLEVVESGILGTSEAQERTVTGSDEPEDVGRVHYSISGRGAPRSAERAAWVRGAQ